MIHNKFRYILTLVALFAISTGAWAEETVFEYADPMVGTLTQGTTGTLATTVTINSESVNAIKFSNTYKYADGKYITIAPTSGSFKKGDVLSIAGCISNGNAESNAKAGIYTADGATQLYETANVVNAQLSTDAPVVETYTLTQDAEKLLIARSTGTTALYITTLKVLRTASAPAGIDLTPDATRKIWTLDKMPAGNVELQVEYYPGMLVKPTNLVGGTMEIEGLTDTTLPEGFEKDDDGNIYVAKDTKFTVKAVPAEGYHLVAWSDDATNKELEREFTMTDDDFILTATFSDEYTLTLSPAPVTKATVTIDDQAATPDENGKIADVKAGTKVKLTAKPGFKFRKVTVKGGAKVVPTLKDALKNGATIAITISWNNGAGKQTVFTFTNNNGTYSCEITGDEASSFTGSMVKENTMLSFTADYPSEEGDCSFHFFTSDSSYWGSRGDYITSFAVSVNGTDITDQIHAGK